MFGWTVSRSLVLVASASVTFALLRDGWARVGGWVGRCLGRWQCSECVEDILIVVFSVADVCGCRPAGLGM